MLTNVIVKYYMGKKTQENQENILCKTNAP